MRIYGGQVTVEPLADQGTWRHPSPRMWRMLICQDLFWSVVVGLILGLSLQGVGADAALGSGAGAFALGITWLWVLRRRFRAWRYQEREDDLLVGRGVLFRRLSVVPYGRMQYVEVTAGPIERIFRLATVKMHTAAFASDARIPGLEPDEATRLRDQLAALGEARAAGL
jgi:membrane protein YdbS with pleckstrin-like domain